MPEVRNLQPDCKCCALMYGTQTLRESSVFWNAVRFHGTRVNVISFTYVMAVSFHAQSFTKLLNAPRNHVQIYYTDFHQNTTINWKLMIEIYLRPYVSMNVNVPIFTKHNPALQVFIKDWTEFHENPAEVFVIDCRPQTDRRVLHTPCSFTV